MFGPLISAAAAGCCCARSVAERGHPSPAEHASVRLPRSADALSGWVCLVSAHLWRPTRQQTHWVNGIFSGGVGTYIKGRRCREARCLVLLLARMAQAALGRAAAGCLPLRRLRPRCLGQRPRPGRHIRPRRIHPQLALEPSNCRAPCAAHDNQAHREKGSRAPDDFDGGRVERCRDCGVDGCRSRQDPLGRRTGGGFQNPPRPPSNRCGLSRVAPRIKFLEFNWCLDDSRT